MGLLNGKKRKRKLLMGKIYTFKRSGKGPFAEDHSQIGGPGYSRVVYCNKPDCVENLAHNYADNESRSTKYTPLTFFPKALFEQFRRVANFFFLLIGILAFTPLAPYTPVSAIIPLIVVIAASMFKEGMEDLKRKKQDTEVNNRKVKVHRGGGIFEHTIWKHLRVGDIVKIEKDQFFPADLLLISSSYDDAICYVETMNLDGETNLKLKQAIEVTSSLNEDSNILDFKAMIKCEDPNANLYSFVGTMEFEEEKHPLTPHQLLLRESKLRNTEFVYGAVVFTGRDTKVVQNSTPPPSKRSKIERRMDKIIYFLFFLVFTLASIGSVYFGITTSQDLEDGSAKRWYLEPDQPDIPVYFDPNRPLLAAVLHFFTAVMLFGNFIPISLYISVEVVKLMQTLFINHDILMYYEEADKPAHARTSNLNEELGQVHTILSDKTGTLTCNSMEFIKCSIAGIAYGHAETEAEKSITETNRTVNGLVNGTNSILNSNRTKTVIKGFNFEDKRVMNGNWVNELRSDVIQSFFRLLAICHTAIPVIDEKTGKVSYEAESPDEAAFVIAARELGFEFYNRTQTSVSLHEMDPLSGKRVERVYKLLNVIEFNSSRKRMSVIIKDEDGKILLLCKGADSVMFDMLGNGREFERQTMDKVNEYANSGLRTLILAYRHLDGKEYNKFTERFTEAKNLISADREALLDEVAASIEKDLILLGATAVEDKLQTGVPQCIHKLAQAGIKIWVLTGDKMETAINIGFACSLLRQGMKQIIVNLETPEIIALEKAGERDALVKASKASVLSQIREGVAQVATSDAKSEVLALIIDGKSLVYALEDNMKKLFLELAVGCASVICCRSSPKQKALVTRLVKEGIGKITLAIGDGANDVGMIQEADIGVGISGAEGMQAVMSSDVAIAQFRFLERLLLVHGHWCYRRIASMICYFFFKNTTFVMTVFLYEAHASFSGKLLYNDWAFSTYNLLFTSLPICYFFFKNTTFVMTVFLYEAHASFSGKLLYNDWAFSTYNLLFTSLPVIALGIFDKDVSARLCLKFPLLYQEGIQNVLFKWQRILGWMFNGLCCACIIFFFCMNSLDPQAFDENGKIAGIEVVGTTMYSCVVWVVNCQMFLCVRHINHYQIAAILGEIGIWYLFLVVYGATPPSFCTTFYKLFIESLAPAPSFWIVTFFGAVAALIPYSVYTFIQMRFFPMYHEMILSKRVEEKRDGPEQ